MEVFLLLSFLLNFILSSLQSTTEWNGRLLYDYISPSLKNGSANIDYCIIDPDSILSETAKTKILDKMKKFYQSKNIINYLIIFNNYKSSYYSYDILKDEVNAFSSYMANRFSEYKIKDTLISAFAISERKSRISTGDNIRKLMNDGAVLTILNNRKTELRNKNYDKAMEDQIDDIFKYYGNPLVWYILLGIGCASILALLIVLCRKCCDPSSSGSSGGYDSYSSGGYDSGGCDYGGCDYGGGGGDCGGGGASSDW